MKNSMADSLGGHLYGQESELLALSWLEHGYIHPFNQTDKKLFALRVNH